MIVAFLLKNWREVALVLALAAGLGFVGLAMHWRTEAAQQRLRADAAASQSKMDTATVKIIDHYQAEARTTTQQAETKAHDVETIPSDKLPDDVRAAWIVGLSNGSGAPVPDGRSKPAG